MIEVWIGGVYLVMSVASFIAYGVDKRRAVRGKWRIAEGTLHWLELCGGWPGAAAGQIVFRHKRRKMGYMLVFAGIVALHAGAWGLGVYMGWLP